MISNPSPDGISNASKGYFEKHRISAIFCIIIACGVIALIVAELTKPQRFINKARKEFNDSYLAKTGFFHTTLDETRMKANVRSGDTSSIIFPLIIEEIPNANLTWACYNHLVGGFSCHLEDKHGGYNDLLSYYYWDKYRDEIDEFLAKYPCLSRFGYSIQNSCKDDELLDFSKNILTISDFNYLYRSYKAECDKLGEACDKGGKFIHFSDSSSTPWLFEWMKENGL